MSELIVPCYYLEITISCLIDGHPNGSIFLIPKAFIDVEAFLLTGAIGVEIAVKRIVLIDDLRSIVNDPPINHITIVVKAAGSALGVQAEAEQGEDNQIFHQYPN